MTYIYRGQAGDMNEQSKGHHKALGSSEDCGKLENPGLD